MAVSLLWRAGLTPRQLYLRVAPVSIQGAILLVILSGFIPLAVLLGRGQAWNWLNDLVYAPASAIAQELYFRAALLIALTQLCKRHPRWTLVLQALLFALWHIRAFRVVAFLPAVGVLGLTFVAGLLWGKQVQRDQTLIYAIIQHTVFLIVQ